MEQGRVRAGEAGEHHGIAPVALALVPGDGVELAGIGHDDGGAEAGEVTGIHGLCVPASRATVAAGYWASSNARATRSLGRGASRPVWPVASRAHTEWRR